MAGGTWGKTYLTKAGLLESTRRGHFRITPRGQQVLESEKPRAAARSEAGHRMEP
jgi:restriction system protein